jgi:hypothetical protein
LDVTTSGSSLPYCVNIKTISIDQPRLIIFAGRRSETGNFQLGILHNSIVNMVVLYQFEIQCKQIISKKKQFVRQQLCMHTKIAKLTPLPLAHLEFLSDLRPGIAFENTKPVAIKILKSLTLNALRSCSLKEKNNLTDV